jgi:hypothetical protein
VEDDRRKGGGHGKDKIKIRESEKLGNAGIEANDKAKFGI